MPHRIELIAHRGASRERSENTVAAFRRAAELGADAVELDVHLTADGRLLVHHDPTVDGPTGPQLIKTLTLAAAASFRIGGQPLPTLDDVIAAVGGRTRIYCELKGPGTAAEAVRLLAPLGAGAAVHSFDHRMVAAARDLAPAIARGVLEASYHLDSAFPLRAVDARDLWQSEALIDAGLTTAVHAIGCRVIAWTVDDPSRARQLADLGVDGICTNDPAGIGKALSR